MYFRYIACNIGKTQFKPIAGFIHKQDATAFRPQTPGYLSVVDVEKGIDVRTHQYTMADLKSLGLPEEDARKMLSVQQLTADRIRSFAEEYRKENGREKGHGNSSSTDLTQ